MFVLKIGDRLHFSNKNKLAYFVLHSTCIIFVAKPL